VVPLPLCKKLQFITTSCSNILQGNVGVIDFIDFAATFVHFPISSWGIAFSHSSPGFFP
jgi:hypothetical protein